MPEKLPKGWVKTTLGEVCAMNPRTPFEESVSEHTEVSFVPMAAVEEESGRLDASQIRTLGSVQKGYTPFQENDVIFAKITPCMENGKIALATGLKNGLAYGSTEFFVFRPYQGVLPRFILHFLLQPSFREDAVAQMTGVVGQKRVPSKYLFSHEFQLPPTPEQERIVAKLDAALSRLERAESAANRAQERLKRYRAAVLDSALTGELTRTWRDARLKGKTEQQEIGEDVLRRLLDGRRVRWEKAELMRLREKGKIQKNDHWKSCYPEPILPNTTDLPKLPNTWAWASLDMVAEIGSGISVSQNRPVKNPVELPYLRVANVMRGYFDLSEMKTIRVEKDRVPNYLLQANDILFNEGGDRDKLGRGWVWDGQIGKCVHQNHVFRARPIDPSLLNPKLVSYWGNTFGQHFFIKHGKQTTNLASINRSVLGKMPVPIAPVAEQAEIVRQVAHRLASVDRLASKLKSQLERTRATRNSLLREAFAGRLVAHDLKDEPASMLLEHIRTEKVRREAKPPQVPKAIPSAKIKGNNTMQQQPPLPKSLSAVWEKTARKVNARRLFEAAGFGPENVVQFYEALRATPEVRMAFQNDDQKQRQPQKSVKHAKAKHIASKGRFRLVELWLEDFKNLKDYTIRFDPAHGMDVVLGWNGTGKSNLFEVLVIIFRDLYEWFEKNRWPDKPMHGYRLSYEMDEQMVEITWQPASMKRPELKKMRITGKANDKTQLESIKRDQLPLPRFVFGYYSGPTNRLAEHFLPMKQAHYIRLREAKADDAETLAELLEQRRFFCAETHHAKYVLLAFSYKEDNKISEFLRDRLRIMGFESALFIIRKPRWAKPGSKADDFWGATGIMRRVMERLRRYAIAPMVLEQTVSYGYRSTTEDHYYFFLPDSDSLHSFAAEYEDARSFFLALESTDFSELIHDVKIQVRIKATNTEQVAITFHQLSEGEQQLLMVLGLMRFTKSHQSLVLLDEPDTHLNPHWSVDYIKDLTRVMSDSALESPEQQSSQILMATHDPLVIASLVKEQIHLLKRDSQSGACGWTPASVNPRGLGFTGILTSEMFGFRSDLDPETLADLDTRVRLVAKEGSLTTQEKTELEQIDKRLVDAGFSKAFSDPYYAAFVRAWGRRHSALMAGEQSLTPEKRRKIDQIASEVLKEAIAEVEKGVAS
jgi:restriction endonuclease S subunit/predicted ATPase